MVKAVLCSACHDRYRLNEAILAVLPQETCAVCGRLCLGYAAEVDEAELQRWREASVTPVAFAYYYAMPARYIVRVPRWARALRVVCGWVSRLGLWLDDRAYAVERWTYRFNRSAEAP